MNQPSLARVTAVLGLLLAAGPARADTFSVEASGTASWPLTGGTLVMSPSAIWDVTGTLRDDPANVEGADYVLRTGPGIVALSQSGAYSPALTSTPMQPTTTAAADSSVVFTGPGASVSTQVFVDVSGRFEMTCPPPPAARS